MEPARKKKQEEFDTDAYDTDLLEFKRRAEAAGLKVQIPRRDAMWKEPRPVRIKGKSLTGTLIRDRGSEPVDFDLPDDLAALKRACDEAGVPVRFPRPGAAKWVDFEPLPIDADEISAMVVRLRREEM